MNSASYLSGHTTEDLVVTFASGQAQCHVCTLTGNAGKRMNEVAKVPVAAETTSEPIVSLGKVAMCERSTTSSAAVLTGAQYFLKRFRHGGALCLRARRIDTAFHAVCWGERFMGSTT